MYAYVCIIVGIRLCTDTYICMSVHKQCVHSYMCALYVYLCIYARVCVRIIIFNISKHCDTAMCVTYI